MATNLDCEIIVYTSENCGPCRQLKPNMLKLQDQYRFNMRVIELSDDTRPLFDAANVRATPTVIGTDAQGNRLGIFVGAQSPAILENHLRKWGVI